MSLKIMTCHRETVMDGPDIQQYLWAECGGICL